MTGKAADQLPKLSIVSITYNHEAFIGEALEGFVTQKTDFPLEIIVADDASTDATPEIIQDYANRYPHLFGAILRPANVGIHANLIGALSAARGEYIALCEGDDYWTDPMKLQKQVSYLDSHPAAAVCFHPVRTSWTGDDANENMTIAILRRLEQTFFPTFPPFFWKGDLSLDALVSRNFIQTNSVVYRRRPHYDDIPADVMPLDWFIHVLHAKHGEIAMLPETMGVYRRHAQGIWFEAATDPAKFWRKYGMGHLAVLEAMLNLFPDDPVRETIVSKNADAFISRITKCVTGPEGLAFLTDSVHRYPRVAALAFRHRLTQTRGSRLRSSRHAVAAAGRGLMR